MANKLHLKVVTPSHIFFDGDCDMVIMKTVDGDLGVLYGHQPLTTVLDLGYLRIIDNGDETMSTLLGGFAKVNEHGLTIISDAAEWADEIDVERAIESEHRAEERIKNHGKNIAHFDEERAEAALHRALLRLDLAKTKRKKK